MGISAEQTTGNQITYVNGSTERLWNKYRGWIYKPARFTRRDLQMIVNDMRKRQVPMDAEIMTGGPVGKGVMKVTWAETPAEIVTTWTLK